MAGLSLKPIVPKHPIVDKKVGARVEGELKAWGGRVVNRMASYPAQQPTTYRRTGTLGRNWRLRFGTENGLIFAAAVNATRYAPFVQGPKDGPRGARQTAVMASKGWQSVSTIGRQEWRASSRRIRDLLKQKG